MSRPKQAAINVSHLEGIRFRMRCPRTGVSISPPYICSHAQSALFQLLSSSPESAICIGLECRINGVIERQRQVAFFSQAYHRPIEGLDFQPAPRKQISRMNWKRKSSGKARHHCETVCTQSLLLCFAWQGDDIIYLPGKK